MCDVDPIVAERRALVRFQFNIETICSKVISHCALTVIYKSIVCLFFQYSSISKEKWNEEDDVIVDLRNLKISGKVPLSKRMRYEQITND